jgi:hypothetical protein
MHGWIEGALRLADGTSREPPVMDPLGPVDESKVWTHHPGKRGCAEEDLKVVRDFESILS